MPGAPEERKSVALRTNTRHWSTQSAYTNGHGSAYNSGVEIDRRGFLRVLGSIAAVLSTRADAADAAQAPQIHTATRNTLFGAVGARRSAADPEPPFRRYPDAGRVPLPAAADAGRALGEVVGSYAPARSFEPVSLSLAELASLLFHSNGVTGEVRLSQGVARLRAAPSAGALYSGELYVAVERVTGLEAGLYYYAVDHHRLIRLRSGARLQDVARALERPGEIENAAVVVLLTNVFGRYTRRYANRGYRYALIDSGHIGENLRLAASSAGFADASPLRFRDDALNELLDIDGKAEAVCAVHAVGRARGAVDPAPAMRQHFVEAGPAGELSCQGSLTDRYHAATKLVPARRPLVSAATLPAPSAAISEVAGLRLPKPAEPATTVEASIRARRSAASFARAKLSLPDLAFVLATAVGQPQLTRAPGVELCVVAHRVEGLASGVYRYEPAAHRLTTLRRGDLSRSMVSACLGQDKAGSAAAGLVMAAHLEASSSALGDRRYRDLLLESGAIGQRVYLAAEALGLAARNLAAFRDDRFNELLGLRERRLFALHLTMLGREG